MSSDLPGFIRARLDEDEYDAKVAQLRAPTPWQGESWDDAVLEGDGLVDAKGDGIALVKGDYIRPHIARHDPARVLAEVAAKRAIVAEHDTAGWTTGDRLHDCQWRERPCQTLRLLAAPYATHADYREEWRP